jgi:hypothetical protein
MSTPTSVAEAVPVRPRHPTAGADQPEVAIAQGGWAETATEPVSEEVEEAEEGPPRCALEPLRSLAARWSRLPVRVPEEERDVALTATVVGMLRAVGAVLEARHQVEPVVPQTAVRAPPARRDRVPPQTPARPTRRPSRPELASVVVAADQVPLLGPSGQAAVEEAVWGEMAEATRAAVARITHRVQAGALLALAAAAMEAEADLVQEELVALADRRLKARQPPVSKTWAAAAAALGGPVAAAVDPTRDSPPWRPLEVEAVAPRGLLPAAHRPSLGSAASPPHALVRA